MLRDLFDHIGFYKVIHEGASQVLPLYHNVWDNTTGAFINGTFHTVRRIEGTADFTT